ncbi:MAG: VOC family protein [Variibacter sp.]|nr:VOC family protein [Variibacter sp.]
MDAPSPSSRPTMANRTPMRIGAYALAVRDLDKVSRFYQQMVGLEEMARSAQGATLGIGGVALLHLAHKPEAKPDDPKTAGLFHTAFILPTRRDLAEWYAHALRSGLAITRTGDHDVNEAIYYDDPEGNGGECYADRPPEVWKWADDGTVEIPTTKVDLDDLMRDAADRTGPWRAPAGMRIGHINLRVGQIRPSEEFFCKAVGLDHTGRRDIRAPGLGGTITFMSSGRYHHHVATNNFTSDGAPPRDPQRAGLLWFSIEVEGARTMQNLRKHRDAAGVAQRPVEGGFEVSDPWGTRIRFIAV